MMKNKIMAYIKKVGGVAAICVMLLTGSAHAHKVIVFAWVEGNTVHSESKFHGGRPAKDAPLEVVDLNGQKLLEGRTDDKGLFSFAIPKKTAMKIILKAGMGHQGEWTIPLEELGEVSAAMQPTGEKGIKAGSSSVSAPPKERESSRTATECLTREEAAALVEAALDKKLAPIMGGINHLLDPNKDPSFVEIMGGIGYILGLVGLIAYFQARRGGR